MASNKKYNKHVPQKGNPMWRDPATVGKTGCPLSVLILVAVVGAPVYGVVQLFN